MVHVGYIHGRLDSGNEGLWFCTAFNVFVNLGRCRFDGKSHASNKGWAIFDRVWLEHHP